MSPPLSKHLRSAYIHLISDATGTAAEHMARAALVQSYKEFHSIFIRHPFVKSTARINAILDEAEAKNGVVIYLRKHLAREEARRGLVMLDMLGLLFEKIGRRFKSQPLPSSGLLPNALGDKFLRLAEAIDFILGHGDGRRLRTLGLADVILLGASRTSKTPASLYLSCHFGLRAADVLIVPGLEPPARLFGLKRPKMVGLTISPGKLASIRQGRFHSMMPDEYCNPSSITEELGYCEEVFERIQGIKRIDVTEQPIEEVANLII